MSVFTVTFKPVPKGEQALRPEVLSDRPIERFSPAQVRLICSRYLHPTELINTATLRTWRRRIGVSAGGDGKYGAEEIQYLLDYLGAKDQGLTTAQFLDDYHKGKHASKRSEDKGSAA